MCLHVWLALHNMKQIIASHKLDKLQPLSIQQPAVWISEAHLEEVLLCLIFSSFKALCYFSKSMLFYLQFTQTYFF